MASMAENVLTHVQLEADSTCPTRGHPFGIRVWTYVRTTSTSHSRIRPIDSLRPSEVDDIDLEQVLIMKRYIRRENLEIQHRRLPAATCLAARDALVANLLC